MCERVSFLVMCFLKFITNALDFSGQYTYKTSICNKMVTLMEIAERCVTIHGVAKFVAYFLSCFNVILEMLKVSMKTSTLAKIAK